MIDLSNPPVYDYQCPYCDSALQSGDWYMPGMRKLIELSCRECGHRFYGDLPAGYALFYPALLDRETGEVHSSSEPNWYADVLTDSYADRNTHSVELEVDRSTDPERGVLLNCLDINYGHSLQKLLHADYYLAESDLPVIVLIPPFLQWLVPDEVDAVWTVNVGLNNGGAWSDQLAEDIKKRINQMQECYLDVGTDHNRPEDFEIKRFTGVEPFNIDTWEEQKPTVTFIWRDKVPYGSAERLWCSVPEVEPNIWRPLAWQPLRQLRGLINIGADQFGYSWPSMREQIGNIRQTAVHLKRRHDELNIAVAGVGTSGSFPDWIDDRRVTNPSTEQEVELCQQYARSHVIVGMHGSQMVLPSAHAGAVVELLQGKKWNHYADDISFRSNSSIDSFLRHRMLPAETPCHRVAQIVESVLTEFGNLRTRNQRKYQLSGEKLLDIHHQYDA